MLLLSSADELSGRINVGLAGRRAQRGMSGHRQFESMYGVRRISPHHVIKLGTTEVVEK